MAAQQLAKGSGSLTNYQVTRLRHIHIKDEAEVRGQLVQFVERAPRPLGQRSRPLLLERRQVLCDAPFIPALAASAFRLQRPEVETAKARDREEVDVNQPVSEPRNSGQQPRANLLVPELGRRPLDLRSRPQNVAERRPVGALNLREERPFLQPLDHVRRLRSVRILLRSLIYLLKHKPRRLGQRTSSFEHEFEGCCLGRDKSIMARMHLGLPGEGFRCTNTNLKPKLAFTQPHNTFQRLRYPPRISPKQISH